MKKNILITIVATGLMSAILLAFSSYMRKDLQLSPVESVNQLYISEYLPQDSSQLTVSSTQQDVEKLIPYSQEIYVSSQLAQNQPYDSYKYEAAFISKDDFVEKLDFSAYYDPQTVISLCKDEYFYTSEVNDQFITHSQLRDHSYLLNRKLGDIAKCNVSIMKFGDSNLLQTPESSRNHPVILNDHRLALAHERSYTIDEEGNQGVQIETKERPVYVMHRYNIEIEPFKDYLLQFTYQAHDTLNLRYGVRFFTQKYLDRLQVQGKPEYDPVAWSDIDNEYTDYYFDIADAQPHLLQQIVSTKLDDVIGIEIIYYADSWTNARYSFGMPNLSPMLSKESLDSYRQKYLQQQELIALNLPVNPIASQPEIPFYVIEDSVEENDGEYTTNVYLAAENFGIYRLQFDGDSYTVNGEFGQDVVEEYDGTKTLIGDIKLGRIMNLSLKSKQPIEQILLEKASFYSLEYFDLLFKLDKAQFTSGDYKLMILEKPYSDKYYIADADYYHYKTNSNQNLFLVKSDVTIYPIGYKTTDNIRLLAFLIIPIGVFIMLIYINRAKITKAYHRLNKLYLQLNDSFSKKVTIPALKYILGTKDVKYKHIFDPKSKFWGEIDKIIEKILTDLINKPIGFIFIIVTTIIAVFVLTIPLKNIAILIVFAIMLIWLLYDWDSRVLGLIALIFLCAVPILLVLKKDRYAEGFAIMVYFFLVATVFVQIKENFRQKDG